MFRSRQPLATADLPADHRPARRVGVRRAGKVAVLGMAAVGIVAGAMPAHAAETASNDYFGLSIAGGPTVVRQGSSPTWSTTIQTWKWRKLNNTTFWGVCNGSVGDIGANQTRTTSCGMSNVQPGAWMTQTVGGNGHKWPYTGAGNYAQNTVNRPLVVVNPGIAVSVTANNATNYAGQAVPVTVTVTNSGNTQANGLTLASTVYGCAANLGNLNAGQSLTTQCTIPSTSGQSNASITATVTGTVPGGDYSVGNPMGVFPNGNLFANGTKSVALVQPPTANMTATITNTQPGGWSNGASIAVPVKVKNTSTVAENLSFSASSPYGTCAQSFTNVPAGEERTHTCTLLSATQSFLFQMTGTATAITPGLVPAPTYSNNWSQMFNVASASGWITDTTPSGWMPGVAIVAPVTVLNPLWNSNLTNITATPIGTTPVGTVCGAFPATPLTVSQSATVNCTVPPRPSGGSFTLSVRINAFHNGSPIQFVISEYFLVKVGLVGPGTGGETKVDSGGKAIG